MSHTLSPEQCHAEAWASGPCVNVIDAVCRLPQPIPHKGALSVWHVDREVLGTLQAALAGAPVTHNDVAHLPPPEEVPRRGSRARGARKPRARRHE